MYLKGLLIPANFFSVFFLILTLSFDLSVKAAETGSEQELYDRILDSIKHLEIQRLEEAILSGESDQAEKFSIEKGQKAKEIEVRPGIDGQGDGLMSREEPCFPVHSIEIKHIGEPAPNLQEWIYTLTKKSEGQCLSFIEIKTLQKELNKRLIDRGYITSRVLIPEQKLGDGRLFFLLVAGRIEYLESIGLETEFVQLALPSRKDNLLNIRDLEQAVENINRLPGMDFGFDLKAGTAYGKSILQGRAKRVRPYRVNWLLNESYYDGKAHGNSQLGLEWGGLWVFPDRLSIGINSDLDKEISDKAQGASLNYDVTLGYWLMALSYNHQIYENQIVGVQKIDTSGVTDLSQLELKRIFYRSAHTRLGLSALASYSDIKNLLDKTTIRVSTYRLNSSGLRMDLSQLFGKTQLAASLSYENTRADGSATSVLPGLSVADKKHDRWQLYFSGQRYFSFLKSDLSFKLNSQYSDNELFASERFSLASKTNVRGYDEVYINGNSGMAGSLEAGMVVSEKLQIFSEDINNIIKKLLFRSYLAYDSGIIPDRPNENSFVKLSSLSLGASIFYRKFQFLGQVSWPLEQFSTQPTDHEYTVNTVLLLSY